jgi:signal transduction histidine kinase
VPIALALASHIAIAIENAQRVENMMNIERLISRADAAASLLHRINNDVGLIRTLVEELQEERNPDTGSVDVELLWSNLTDIYSSARDVLQLVNNLKSSDQLGRTELVSPLECARRAQAEFDPAVDNIEIQIDEALNGVPPIYATQMQLADIFRNFIRNARDAMEAAQAAERKISIELDAVLDDFVSIAVVDTGPGVSPRVRDKLFQLGVSTKDPGQGGGHGLWLTRIWLQRWGGTVYYDPNHSPGARFVLELPRQARYQPDKGGQA